MTTLVATRKRRLVDSSEPATESAASETAALQAVLQEMRQMREEQAHVMRNSPQCFAGTMRSSNFYGETESVENLENLGYEELKSKLELRFGEGQLSQNYYTQFTNRRQRFGEDLATFGHELERLSRLAYPECPYAVRDKIACAQFVSSLSDGFVRRTLQLEGITSLKLAIERAKAVKIIQGGNFERRRDFEKRFEKGKDRGVKSNEKGDGDEKVEERRKKGYGYERRDWNRTKECWNCGKEGHFRYKGMLDGNECCFKIDTGSDVSILSRRMVREGKHIIQIKDNSLRYPTGEVVPIEFKVMAKVLLGKYFVEIPMYVIDMDDDCLLGVDFLRKINLENVFEFAFISSESDKEKVLSCSRIQVSSERAPFLKELYTNNSSNLNKAQKEIFTDFLEEYQDVFSEEIVAGNCGVVEHVINLEDSSPIKQVPRRIPLRMRGEVEKIIEEVRKQGVIEESQSPWVSPAVLEVKYLGHIVSSGGVTTDPEKISAVKDWPIPHNKKQLRSFLGWLMSFKNLEGQLARWLERLQQYEFEIIHRKGLIHKNADGLSRRQCESFGCEYCVKVERRQIEESRKSVARIILIGETLQDWRKEQLEDVSIAFIYRGKETGIRPSRFEIPAGNVSARIYWSYWDALSLKDGVLYKRWEAPNLKSSIFQLIVPRNRVNQILEEAHDSFSGGHFGVNKTLEKIRKRFYWATCKQDVEEWCKTCKVCVSKKGPLGKGKSPLQIYNVGAPFERLQMDILGPLPITTSGNRYLLVIVDCFTKWVEVFPIRNIRASTVAEVFVNQVISRHGVPLEVHTDQGKNFESKLFAELMNLLGIRKTRTTALHPQSDGQVERQHQTIVNYLAKYISENQKDWDRWVPMFLLAYRSSKHETTGVTPAELCFARDLRLPLDLLLGSPPRGGSQSVEGFIGNLKEKLDKIHSNVRERMDIKSSRAKSWYDRKARQTLFQEGEKVWFYNPRRMKGRAPKLQSNWEGPFLIVKKLNDVVYCIQRSIFTEAEAVVTPHRVGHLGSWLVAELNTGEG
ncbi:uncharacterized protein [Temnothorax longispinosus]|uniref:uncharacterized protein n=1 Tax=Temnothorax longispinosus TaxID=300112 RepID=UPI003A99599B